MFSQGHDIPPFKARQTDVNPAAWSGDASRVTKIGYVSLPPDYSGKGPEKCEGSMFF